MLDEITLKRAAILFCCINAALVIYLSAIIFSPAYFTIFRFNSLIRDPQLSPEAREDAMLEEQAKLGREIVVLPNIDTKALIKRSEEARNFVYPSALIQRVNEINKEAAEREKANQADEIDRIREEKLIRDALQITSTNATKGKPMNIRRLGLSHEEFKVREFAEAVKKAIISQDEPEKKIPGPELKPECNAKAHTDYKGSAVVWGTWHRVMSAADCCQACIDQAKKSNSTSGRCNIWVYCPDPLGCYSSSILNHKHQECWLKHASKISINAQGFYSEQFLIENPKSPDKVQWISGSLGF